MTWKQAFLINIMRGIYFVFRAYIRPDHPYHAQVAELLDKADRLNEDWRSMLERRIVHLEKWQQKELLEYIEEFQP